MKKVLVTYKVKNDKVEENKNLIKKVFSELKTNGTEGIKYASFISEDGVSFFHIASIETEDGSNPLSTSEAFKSFTAEIKDRCEIPPKAIELSEVGNYNLF